MESIDVAVIGGGVTGLAAALCIARTGRSTCVLERHRRPGLDASTHNSGVVHAGLYYPTGSLKARLCVEGNRRLYEFCAQHGVPHARTGKIVVACEPHELPALEALQQLGAANGVEALEIVDAAFVAQREPNVRAIAALYSPDSGVVNAEAYVRALLRSAEGAGAIFLPGSKLLEARARGGAMELTTARETIVARQVVNAAGLFADDVSRMLGGERFTIYPCRGEWATLVPSRRPLLGSLVYPLPHASGHGLGVHFVRTTDGEVWLGPTVRYQERKDDYEEQRLPLPAFVEPAQRLMPDITIHDLRLGGSGIRAKLHPATESFADFLIRRDRINPAVIQAAGIESPGLTSSLAVGQLVARIVGDADICS